MYRIMIVDDEPLILAGITSLLEWEEWGCTIVGKAANGQQALAKIREVHPDIIITDIKMPAMDGIAFMKEAKKIDGDMAFILLTNLEEFSMAKEAIRLGAIEYLIKLELNEEILVSAIKKAIVFCEDRRKIQNNSNQPDYATSEETMKGYLRNLLLFETEPNVDDQIYQYLERTFSDPVILLINFNYGFKGYPQNFDRDDQNKIMGYAENVLSEMVNGFFEHSCLIRREQNGFVLILSVEGVREHEEKISSMGKKFLTIIKDYFGASAMIAISQQGKGIEDFPELMYQAMNAMNYAYYETMEPIVKYSDACEENKHHRSSFNINFLKKDLSTCLRHNNSARFKEIMDQLITLLKEYKPSKAQTVNACSNLYYFISSFFEEQENSDFPYSVNIIGELNQLGNLQNIIQWLEWFGEQIQGVLDKKGEGRVEQKIELAKIYVEEHYHEKITLGQVAEHLCVSQGHLSNIFSKYTGKKFTDYVTEIKIDKARELIASHQYMMYEISDMLGFDTPFYFSTVFKKITGVSPKEYENKTLSKL